MTESAPSPAATATLAVASPRGRGIVIGAMLFAVALIVAYWAIWYLIDRDILASSHAPVYYAFENAFPAADGWLALALLLAVAGILRRRPSALLWTLLTGGAGIYLGYMDVLFDLENGIYRFRPGADPSGPLVEVTINALTFALGAAIIAWARRHRRALLAGASPSWLLLARVDHARPLVRLTLCGRRESHPMDGPVIPCRRR